MSMSPQDLTPNANLSPAEEHFEGMRKRVGWYLAPVVLVVLWWIPLPGLTEPARHLFAIVGMALTLWMTEAIPLAATALLAPSLCVVAGLGSARDVFKPFADPVIFLFMGSFMMGEAMLKHGLNRRFAFTLLAMPWVGSSPARLYAAFAGITALISMWVSNAATTAMMLPIGLSILAELGSRQGVANYRTTPFAAGLMLITAFAASVGGLATPIGTPPNLIGIGAIERLLGYKVTFFQWMRLGLPIAILLAGFLVWRFSRHCPVPAVSLATNRHWLETERASLGRWTRGQLNVVAVFLGAVALWILPGLIAALDDRGSASPAYVWISAHAPESIIGLLAASALFFLPTNAQGQSFTLEWRDAAAIDWGTILLFAGGMSLGELMFSTGLAHWIGAGLATLFHSHSVVGLTVLFTGVGILVSETTTNTASATMVVPIAIAVSQAAGVDPLKPALATCLGCSMGFLLPVSTGPNAMAYGTGCIPLKTMMRHGLWLDAVGWVVIVGTVLLLGPSLPPKP
jgi:solute carrier family 13 (sodium-dependent dicarboxylate transporter), member 2/3/5